MAVGWRHLGRPGPQRWEHFARRAACTESGKLVIGDSFAAVTVTGLAGPANGNDFNVQVHVYGSEGADTISAGDDMHGRLYGLGGDDILTGGGWEDSLFGGSGNDTLLARGQWDELFGGDGNDVLNFESAQNGYSEGGLGADTFVFRTDVVGNEQPFVYMDIGGFDVTEDKLLLNEFGWSLDRLNASINFVDGNLELVTANGRIVLYGVNSGPYVYTDFIDFL